MTQVEFHDCTAEPMGAYLKSLAILRLISEQKDPNARGWWNEGVFCIESSLDQDGIVQFFLDEYRPTPIVAPWNGGSGFYEGDNREGPDAILTSTDTRFALYQKTIKEILNWPEMPQTGLKLGQMIEKLEKVEKVANRKDGEAREKLLGLVNEAKSKAEAVSLNTSSVNPIEFTIEELEQKASAVPTGASSAIKELLSPAKRIRTKVKLIARSAAKGEIIQACRNRLCQEAIEWVDAAVVIGSEGKLAWPPILGTGGNESRFDYTNTFMNNIRQLLIERDKFTESKKLLRNALFGDTTDGYSVVSVGQFDPGRAGGFNQGFGVEQKNFPTNPWNFVLTLEGAVLWTSSIGKRNAVEGRSFLKSPFTVLTNPVGYSSSSVKDETDSRAEIWMPLWSRPIGISELRAFLGEGRSEVGKRRARNTIEFAEAVSSLGVDRGVTEFIRYSLLRRRGENYIALPTGRLSVTYRREADLIRELDPILRKLDNFLGKFKQVPAQFTNARRQIDSAIYEVLTHGGAVRMKNLLRAIGQIEQLLARRDLKMVPMLERPLSGLSPRWLDYSDDGCIEIRIAAALASIGATDDVGPVRANLEPIDPGRPYQWKTSKEQTQWSGNTFASRVSSVLMRRMMDSERLNCKSNPVRGDIMLTLEDIASFIEGDTDDNLVQDLLFGLMWVKWSDRDEVRNTCNILRERWRESVNRKIVPRSWALLKLLFLPHPIRIKGQEPVSVKPEPSIIPLLKARRIENACAVARGRLYSSGVLPVEADFPDTGNGERIAAALLLPARNDNALVHLVLKEKT